jgi:hypothetical protein
MGPVTLLLSGSMHATRQPRALGFGRAMRIITALATMTQLFIVAAAPLAERAASDVAAVHVEQAGTRTHHAHDELCATCVALHLLWTPPREPIAAIATPAHTRPRTDQPSTRSWSSLAVLLPRAPPV